MIDDQNLALTFRGTHTDMTNTDGSDGNMLYFLLWETGIHFD